MKSTHKTSAPATRALAAALAIGCVASVSVQAAEYTQTDAAKSELIFISKQMGVEVDGRFKRFTSTLSFDPAKPTAGRAEIIVELASVDTGVPEADSEVVGKDWFDVAKFPTARFTTQSVSALGGDRYEASGQLTIKGRSKTVKAPFTFRENGGRATFAGQLSMLRADFGVGEGMWADFGTVANEIILRFRIEALPAKN